MSVVEYFYKRKIEVEEFIIIFEDLGFILQWGLEYYFRKILV